MHCALEFANTTDSPSNQVKHMNDSDHISMSQYFNH